MASQVEILNRLVDSIERLKSSYPFLGDEILPSLYELGRVMTPPEPILGSPRSSKWPRVRQKHLEKFPTCACCGSRENIQVHHIVAYSDDPHLELEPSNLISLCMTPHRFCHFVFGHAWNWSDINPGVREDAARFLALRNRPQNN